MVKKGAETLLEYLTGPYPTHPYLQKSDGPVVLDQVEGEVEGDQVGLPVGDEDGEVLHPLVADLVVAQVEQRDLLVGHGLGEHVDALVSQGVVGEVQDGDVVELVHAAHHVVEQSVRHLESVNLKLSIWKT